MKKKRFGVSEALSRGLSDTINVVENNSGVFRNAILPLSRIELDPDNPRKLAISLEDVRQGLQKTDPLFERKSNELEKLRELAFTIANNGVINPVVVYKRGELYRIVAGERRCLASILAGKAEIEARVFNEKPKGYELKLIQWVENTAREDLTLNERIGNIRDIFTAYQSQHGVSALTATLLKNMTGLSLPQASYYLSVINAPEDVQTSIEKNELRSLDKAAILASVTETEIRQIALHACVNGCSLKELRQIITRSKQTIIPIKTSSEKKRGRTLSRVNMGSTHNTRVIHAIVHAVITRPEYANFSEQFAKIQWNHYEQATQGFKKMVTLLEEMIAG